MSHITLALDFVFSVFLCSHKISSVNRSVILNFVTLLPLTMYEHGGIFSHNACPSLTFMFFLTLLV